MSPRARRWIGRGIILAVLVATALLVWHPVVAWCHLGAGARDLARAQAVRDTQLSTDNPALGEALRHFQRAVALAPSDGYAYRRLAEAWLVAGKGDEALKALGRAVDLRPHDPVVHIDIGYAWDGLGRAEEAVLEWERAGYGPAAEAAMVNYLKLADWQIAASGGDKALTILEDRALFLDPNGLPAQLRVARLYEGMSQEGAEFARPVRERLRHFALKSVAIPSDPRLADYLTQAMIALTQDGTWTPETLHDVVAVQAWQFAAGPSGSSAEEMLLSLAQHFPEDADLLFYLGELYQRREDLDRAAQAYEQVLAMDPAHASAALRLGMVSEARSKGSAEASLADAAAWYERYAALAPEDLLGLRRLVEVYEALGRSEAIPLRAKLSALTDDRSVVAEQLGVPVGDVQLGPDLIANGDFEEWKPDGDPAAWVISDMFSRAPFGDAEFVSGPDTLWKWDGQKGVRITGLWTDQQPDQSQPRAGFWAWNDAQQAEGWISIEAGHWYLISAVVQAPSDNLSLWVTDEAGILFKGDRFLPATGGQTRRYAAVFQSQVSGRIRPLIRWWGTGSAWFDSLAIRQVVDTGPTPGP